MGTQSNNTEGLTLKELKKITSAIKYIDVNKFVTQCFITYFYNHDKSVKKEEMLEIFKFQFYMLRQKMNNNEFVKLPKFGSFHVKRWTDVLERERILFGIKNPKTNYELTKQPIKLKASHIDYNYLIYNEMRSSCHTNFYDIDLYEKEMMVAYDKYKDSIISIKMLEDAVNNTEVNNLIRRMLYSKRVESKAWYKSKKERTYKINHHFIEGYESKRDKYKKFLNGSN